MEGDTALKRRTCATTTTTTTYTKDISMHITSPLVGKQVLSTTSLTRIYYVIVVCEDGYEFE